MTLELAISGHVIGTTNVALHVRELVQFPCARPFQKLPYGIQLIDHDNWLGTGTGIPVAATVAVDNAHRLIEKSRRC